MWQQALQVLFKSGSVTDSVLLDAMHQGVGLRGWCSTVFEHKGLQEEAIALHAIEGIKFTEEDERLFRMFDEKALVTSCHLTELRQQCVMCIAALKSKITCEI